MLSHLFWSVLISGGGCVFLLYLFQHKLVYVPYMPPEARSTFLPPEQFGLKNYEQVMFSTPDSQTLQGLLVKRPNNPENAMTVLYFHGNAGNLSYRLPSIKDMVEKMSVNVFIISYRGYGLSSGEPSERGLKIDAQAALDFLLKRTDIDFKQIVVFGRSLGGAVGIDLVSRNNDKVLDLMDILFPVLRYFKALCTNPWRSDMAIRNVTVPTYFITGSMDELIPPWMMQKLHNNSPSPQKTIKHFARGTHMDTYDQPGYVLEWINYLETVRRIED